MSRNEDDQHEPTSGPCPDSGASTELPDLGDELRHAAREGLFLRTHAALVRMEGQDGVARDVDAPDEDGETALTLAAAHGHGRVLELLLAKGADDTRCPHDDDMPIPLVRHACLGSPVFERRVLAGQPRFAAV